MTKQPKILRNPIGLNQLRQKCEITLAGTLLSAHSCIVVTPPLPPHA